MDRNQATPLAGAQFDITRFGMEVAGEIGVDPNNLGQYGLTEEQIQQYEQNLHSRNRRRSRR